jgi:hypothetical protein
MTVFSFSDELGSHKNPGVGYALSSLAKGVPGTGRNDNTIQEIFCPIGSTSGKVLTVLYRYFFQHIFHMCCANLYRLSTHKNNRCNSAPSSTSA